MNTWTLPESYSNTYRLQFTDPSFHGLEVIMKRHTFDAVDAAARCAVINLEAIRKGEFDPVDWANLQMALAEFCDALVSWNYVDKDGQPVGTTLSVIRRLDLIFVMQIFLVWARAIIRNQIDENPETEIPTETMFAGAPVGHGA